MSAGRKFLCVFWAGAFALTAGCVFFPKKPVEVRNVRSGGYSFINPLLECEGDLWQNTLLRPFEKKVKAQVQAIITGRRADHVSIYYRDLNNGPWIGINEAESFSPASLLKVPLMISWFKIAETDPKALLEEAQITSVDKWLESAPYFPTSSSLQPGRYTVNELIRRMIVYSDNNAMSILTTHVNKSVVDKVYSDLEVPSPFIEHPKDFVSVKQYASFFRLLYNATYLNRDYSEKALALLSDVEFDKGLTAWLPPNIPVAHKYGERSSGDIKQLHDCGIVYYPKRPYLLAIMTRGRDFEELASVIADLSRFVYLEVDEQMKKGN